MADKRGEGQVTGLKTALTDIMNVLVSRHLRQAQCG